jgi:hypothetical protein
MKRNNLKEIYISHSGIAGGAEDRAILKLMKTFGAENIGYETLMLRELKFEVPAEKYDDAIKALLKRFKWLRVVK